MHCNRNDRRKFLADLSLLAGASALGLPAFAQKARPEKEALKFGFIKLTDCAPLVVAYEKKFFDDEGLFVTLEAQANWKVLLDRVIDGQLDGSHMLAGQPLGATIGVGTQSPVVTAFSMDLNGNGICDPWESAQACPNECTPQACNYNRFCESWESKVTCPTDCGFGCNNNGVCEGFENQFSCPRDCASGCNHNGLCELGETAATCSDCLAGPSPGPIPLPVKPIPPPNG